MRDEIRSEKNFSTADMVVLFSGGRDSSLAVCKLAANGKNLILMNCFNGTTIGNDVIQTRYRALKERFPDRIKDFVQVPIFGLFRTLAIAHLEKDFKCYKTCQVCLGCKMAAHTHAIIFCIDNDIKVIADGYNQYQSGDFMEQRPEAIEIMKNFSSEYGILYINPVYDYKDKNEVKYALYDYGISSKSLEGTCIFGDTFSTPHRDNIISYISERLQICRNFIKERTIKEKAITQKPKIHKIGAVIVKNKKVLVVRKKNTGRTEFIIPGAVPEEGEAHEDTLKRGLKRELGVNVINYRLMGSFSEIAIFENIPIYVDIYYVEIKGEPKPQKSIKEIAWIDADYTNKGIKVGTVLSRHVLPKLITMELI